MALLAAMPIDPQPAPRPSSGGLPEAAAPLALPYSPEARFDTVFRPTSHNSYLRDKAPRLLDVLEHLRSIEVDIWDDAGFWLGARPRHWFVRHLPWYGNDNNASPPGDLDACLGDVAGWSRAHPGHELVTVFVEKKQAWKATHGPAVLDEVLVRALGRDRLLAPQDLMKAQYPSLRAVARANAWPTEGELRGRIAVVLHGGRWHGLRANQTLNAYADDRRGGAVCFVAPEAFKPSHVSGAPPGFADEVAEWVVFFNLSKGHERLAPIIREAHCLSRVWGVARDDASYSRVVGLGANFIGLDDVTETGWLGGRMSGVSRVGSRLREPAAPSTPRAAGR
ncbi:MAG TPA: Ca2+-dependent phosphoinositide-specific phospholipase C [Myxococcales bacterium]